MPLQPTAEKRGGFTGTPIKLQDANTRAVFSVYDIRCAVEEIDRRAFNPPTPAPRHGGIPMRAVDFAQGNE